MNEKENNPFYAQDANIEQAPSSLMPILLAHLGLNESERVPPTPLVALRTALTSPEWTVRIEAVQELERLSDQESFQLLLAALQDEDGSVRACAVRVLSVRGNQAQRDVLEQLEIALHDSEWHVRETAIYALGKLGTWTSLSLLRSALYDPDEVVCRAALQVMQQLQNKVTTTEQSEDQPDLVQAPHSLWGVIGTWSIRRFVLNLRSHSSHEVEKDLEMLEETQEVKVEYPPMAAEKEFDTKRQTPPQLIRPPRRLIHVLEQILAAVLILAIIAGWFALSHLPHSSSGSPTAFNDVDAQPLGAPISTLQINVTGSERWLPNSHTFISLQVDKQKHKLMVNVMDAARRHSTTYPVLDSSWLSVVNLNGTFSILNERYLLALRAQGQNQATLEIWDIIEQHAVTTQTVPALIERGGYVALPEINVSDNEQKFAMYSPDGIVTIWDVASGKKLITCEGKNPLNLPIAYTKWYNHDQNILFYDPNPTHDGNSQIQGWNAITGTRLFQLNDSSKIYTTPLVSPDNKYLALSQGAMQKGLYGDSYYFPEAVEILDAYSGRVLHSHRNGAREIEIISGWLPDSQRLLITNNIPHYQISTWNILNNQVALVASPASPRSSTMADGQYVIVADPATPQSIQIWQISTGHLIATMKMPRADAGMSFFATSNKQYLVMGQKGSFYIWSVATGKLLYTYHDATLFPVSGQTEIFVSWSPDEKYLAMFAGKTATIGEGSLAIWRIP